MLMNPYTDADDFFLQDPTTNSSDVKLLPDRQTDRQTFDKACVTFCNFSGVHKTGPTWTAIHSFIHSFIHIRLIKSFLTYRKPYSNNKARKI